MAMPTRNRTSTLYPCRKLRCLRGITVSLPNAHGIPETGWCAAMSSGSTLPSGCRMMVPAHCPAALRDPERRQERHPQTGFSPAVRSADGGSGTRKPAYRSSNGSGEAIGSTMDDWQRDVRYRYPISRHNLTRDKAGRSAKGVYASKTITLRATSPAFMSSKPSLICSSLMRRLIMSSSLSLPSR